MQPLIGLIEDYNLYLKIKEKAFDNVEGNTKVINPYLKSRKLNKYLKILPIYAENEFKNSEIFFFSNK